MSYNSQTAIYVETNGETETLLNDSINCTNFSRIMNEWLVIIHTTHRPLHFVINFDFRLPAKWPSTAIANLFLTLSISLRHRRFSCSQKSGACVNKSCRAFSGPILQTSVINIADRYFRQFHARSHVCDYNDPLNK